MSHVTIPWRTESLEELIMEVLTRTVPERTIAVMSAELGADQLDHFIESSFGYLFRILEDQGARSPVTSQDLPTYVLFHGPVTTSAPALVEVCVPFHGEFDPPADVRVRVDPSHRQAYVTATKQQLQMPQVMERHQAVMDYATAHGGLCGPTREVFITDVMAAADDDHVADVATPLQ